jgi:hypothetical protein
MWLVLIVGRVDRSAVGSARRTEKYEPEDFDLLEAIVERFELLLTTPHILAEVSNLIGMQHEHAHRLHFNEVAARIRTLDERYEGASLLSDHPSFEKLGLTDTGIASLGRSGCLTVTDDFPLSGRMEHLGLNVLNFTHLQTSRWFTPE